MLYRKVPKNGDELSILGFGCMRLPMRNGRIDVPTATKQLHYAIDNGVNFIDTAMPYHNGTSEPFLGKALSDGYREKVKICTKLPPWSIKTRKDMDSILDLQIKRLNVEHLDYYLVHALNKTYWKDLVDIGLLDFLDSAKQDGRVKNVGFSFHDDIGTFKKIIDAYDWTSCLVMYSYMDNKNQAGDEGVKYAYKNDVAVFAMEPLRGGNLSKTPPDGVQEIFNRSNIVRSPAEWALRWTWDHPEVTLLLSGMNNMDHIKENIRIADEAKPHSLTSDEQSIIGDARYEFFSLMKVQCTGCRYCMPCPFGVDIPTCFDIYNSKYLYGDNRARLTYMIRVGGIMGDKSNASMCTQCGKCLSHCPQEIQIPDVLKDVSRDFEGVTYRPMVWFAKKYLAFQSWRHRKDANNMADLKGDEK